MSINKRLSIRFGALGVLILCLIPAAVQASQVFRITDVNTRNGMLVSLTKNSGVVEPASDKNKDALIGVVGNTSSDTNPVAGQISVETEGVVDTLVSTVAGDITVGDRISPSTVVGFGAKNSGDGWIVGIAQGELSAKSNGAVKTTLTDSSGTKQEVYVANIPVLITVMYYSSQDQSEQDKALQIPESIQSVADTIAGKRASTMAVVLSFILLLAGITMAGVIVAVSSRKTIESIARQPLAKQAIKGRMFQSFGGALGLVVAVIIGAFVLIRVL